MRAAVLCHFCSSPGLRNYLYHLRYRQILDITAVAIPGYNLNKHTDNNPNVYYCTNSSSTTARSAPQQKGPVSHSHSYSIKRIFKFRDKSGVYTTRYKVVLRGAIVNRTKYCQQKWQNIYIFFCIPQVLLTMAPRITSSCIVVVVVIEVVVVVVTVGVIVVVAVLIISKQQQ